MGFSLALMALLTASSADASPTRGDSYRAIATDQAAFNEADTNQDGKISDNEFEDYHANQISPDRSAALRARGAIGDTNRDGAFTPDELYSEARNFDRDGYYPARERYRRDNYYGNPYDE